MPHVMTPDGDIYYEDHGQGTPLVMLRGLGRSIRHWHGFDRQMAEHFRVITMDLRGIGRTTRRAQFRDTLFDLADDLMMVLDECGINRAHVLGVSLGGMITLACGLRHPERCRSLTVVNTSIAGQGVLRLSPKGAGILVSGTTLRRAKIHHMLAGILTGDDFTAEDTKALAEKYASIADQEGMPEKAVLRQLLGAARFRVRSSLRQLDVPTLVMYGNQDRFVPTANSKKLFRLLPHAKLVSIEGGGHELTVDRPREVMQAVIDWTQHYD